MSTTAASAPAAPSAPGELTRVWNVVRLHLVNRWNYIGLPWIILGCAFTISLFVWIIIVGAAGANATEGTQYSGAVSSIFIYMLVVAVQSINLTFPFALGYSVTRRDFYLGTSLLFVLISAMNAAVLTVLSYLEDITGGWWVGGHMFTVVWVSDGPLLQRLFVFFALQLFFFFIGASIATVYMRWRITGMVVLWVALALVFVGLFALLVFTDSWSIVGDWFVAVGAVGAIAWSLVITVLAGLLGYFVLRGATPKN
ncbi:ABC transporter permease [Compostimonas suwonensis]|uniref:Uncharacterized protein n=1 Tax=Compostimonas suwonensis TaxID=1048394 RepID=A0A2M9BUR1_9MICO|nr:ABC transporter permease [Compostimonas suwonensis]PJJ61632.1 hypothetical protein CLV54_2580 [Compostimonas suwonensis]